MKYLTHSIFKLLPKTMTQLYWLIAKLSTLRKKEKLRSGVTWRGTRWERGNRGGRRVESGGSKIRECSRSDSSCDWCVTVSDWATEIGLEPTTLISSVNTHAYTQIHKTHLINDHIYSGRVFIKTCMFSEPPFVSTRQRLTICLFKVQGSCHLGSGSPEHAWVEVLSTV